MNEWVNEWVSDWQAHRLGSCLWRVEKGAWGAILQHKSLQEFPTPSPPPESGRPPLWKQIYILEPGRDLILSMWDPNCEITQTLTGVCVVCFMHQHTTQIKKKKEPKDRLKIRRKQSGPSTVWTRLGKKSSAVCCTNFTHSSRKHGSNTRCLFKPTSQSWLRNTFWRCRQPNLTPRTSVSQQNRAAPGGCQGASQSRDPHSPCSEHSMN